MSGELPDDYRETLVDSIVRSGVTPEAAEETADSILATRQMLRRQDEAYRGPSGSWAQRWLPGVCRHEDVRCTHGDEIIHHRFRRRVCRVCGRSLKGPLPEVCFFGGTHLSREVPDDPR